MLNPNHPDFIMGFFMFWSIHSSAFKLTKYKTKKQIYWKELNILVEAGMLCIETL